MQSHRSSLTHLFAKSEHNSAYVSDTVASCSCYMISSLLIIGH